MLDRKETNLLDLIVVLQFLRSHIKKKPTNMGTQKNQQYDVIPDGEFDEFDKQAPRSPRIGKALSSRFIIFFTAITIVGVIAVIAYKDQSQNSDQEDTSITINTVKQTTKDRGLTLKRSGYEGLPYFDVNRDEVSHYVFLDPYSAVVEPGVEMELHVYDGSTPVEAANFKVCDTNDGGKCSSGRISYDKEKDSYTSTPVTIQCSPHTEFSFYVSVNGEEEGYEGLVVCLYVRRELRTLTDVDREKFLLAMVEMYTLSDEAGQKKYGTSFKNATHHVAWHHFNAGNQDADHLHDGVGFLLSHVRASNVFETSLQVVDPSLTLPYWDFVMDQQLGKYAYNSEIMSEKFFGSMHVPAEYTGYGPGYATEDSILEFHIRDGYFKKLPAEANYMLPSIRAGYGYMRGAWNSNPNPYISRFSYNMELPSCYDYYKAFQLSDKLSFMNRLAQDPHTPVHYSIGGEYGCDLLEVFVTAKIVSIKELICKHWMGMLKRLWRDNYIQPSNDCVVATDNLQENRCHYKCLDRDLVGEYAMIWHEDYILKKRQNDETKEFFASFICGESGDASRVFSGDHVESASAADPSFWPMHPFLDRALQMKLMAGGFATTDWPDDPYETYICLTPVCYSPDTGTTEQHDRCCFGHREGDSSLDYEADDRYILDVT